MFIIFFLAPEDYESIVSSIITFSLAQTSATVSVTIVDDDALENVEQFTVEVVATGGQARVDVGDAAIIYISNDDCEISSYASLCFSCLACLPTWRSACLSVCLCVCFSIGLSVSLFICLPSTCLPACLLVHMSNNYCLSVFVCLSACLSVSLPVCFSISLS